MPIKTTLRRLIMKIGPAMVALGQNKFRGRLQLKFFRILAAVDAERELWDKARQAIIKRIDCKDENGDYHVPKDKMYEFNDESDDILESEMILRVRPLLMSELAKYDLPPAALCDLGPLLIDDQKPDKEEAEDKSEAEDEDEDET